MRGARLLAAAAVAVLAACGGDASPGLEGLPAVTATPRSVPPRVEALPVTRLTGPGGEPFFVTLRRPGDVSAVHRPIGTETFELSLRGEPLSQYPCTSCHVGPLVTTDRPEDAHQNVQPVHPSEFAGACDVCHARADVYQLRLIGGRTVPIDEAYQLCGQCHANVLRDWAGGAHGKRLDVYRGPRVVMGCGDCHDPHAPETPVRIPYPGPELPATTPSIHPPGG